MAKNKTTQAKVMPSRLIQDYLKGDMTPEQIEQAKCTLDAAIATGLAMAGEHPMVGSALKQGQDIGGALVGFYLNGFLMGAKWAAVFDDIIATKSTAATFKKHCTITAEDIQNNYKQNSKINEKD